MTLEASADAKATPTSDIDAVLAMPATAALLNLASLCTASDMVMTEASAKAAEAALKKMKQAAEHSVAKAPRARQKKDSGPSPQNDQNPLLLTRRLAKDQ